MLFNLEPDISVTGGAWYSDQDFESEFVEVLNQQCYKYLQQRVRYIYNELPFWATMLALAGAKAFLGMKLKQIMPDLLLPQTHFHRAPN